MGLLRSFICRIRGPLPSRLEGPVDPFPPHVTAHQTPSSPEVITQPSSSVGTPLSPAQRHRHLALRLAELEAR
ncbi:hypothetical protein NDU88_011574 [Pleurodeles waltl]|uniref:Uncharacterized protein n=1 Tax=Pleurodeles waltl TaxID=8319 RepID=A0AAV7Q1S9_PLEWA|nr:hypothetical protein NDU88_011574 [Pleurodeles waltl]